MKTLHALFAWAMATAFLTAGCGQEGATLNLFPPPFTGCAEELASLRSSDPERSSMAAIRLQGCPSKATKEALLRTLSQPNDETTRWCAAISLRRIGGMNDRTTPLTKSQDAKLRYFATVALYRPDPLRLGYLINDPEPTIRSAFAWHLWGTGSPLLAQRLKVETDAGVRKELTRYLKSKPRVERRLTIEEVLRRNRRSRRLSDLTVKITSIGELERLRSNEA